MLFHFLSISRRMPRPKVQFDDFTRHFYQVIQPQLYAQARLERRRKQAQEQILDRRNWAKKYYADLTPVANELPSKNSSLQISNSKGNQFLCTKSSKNPIILHSRA